MARILIIERDEHVGSLLCAVLEEAGHRCSVVNTAGKALTFVEALAPDLVVADVPLPDKAALALVGELRARGMHVVVTTGSLEVIEYLETEGLLYLQKPFRLHDLTSSIDLALASPKSRVRHVVPR